jgi:hypothetical protein
MFDSREGPRQYWGGTRKETVKITDRTGRGGVDWAR